MPKFSARGLAPERALPRLRGMIYFPRQLSAGTQRALAPFETQGVGGWWARHLADFPERWTLENRSLGGSAELIEIVHHLFPQSVRRGGQAFVACAVEVAQLALDADVNAERGFVTNWFSYLPGEWRRRSSGSVDSLWARWEWLQAHLRGAEFPKLRGRVAPVGVEHLVLEAVPEGFPLSPGRYLLRPDEEQGVAIMALDSTLEELWETLEEGLVVRSLPPEWIPAYERLVQNKWVNKPEGGTA